MHKEKPSYNLYEGFIFIYKFYKEISYMDITYGLYNMHSVLILGLGLL